MPPNSTLLRSLRLAPCLALLSLAACEPAATPVDPRAALTQPRAAGHTLTDAERDALVSLAAERTPSTLAAADRADLDDALAVVALVDERRLRAGQPPLVAGQWTRGGAQGAVTVAPCGELLTDAAPNASTASLRWPGERPTRAVEARLAGWVTSCSDVPTEPVWVRPVPEAPLLVAWWPEDRTLLVHPAALELLDDARQPVDARFGVAEQPILATLGACEANLAALCDGCTSDPSSDVCLRQVRVDLSTGQRFQATCAELDLLPGGAGDYYDELCIGQLIGGHESCVSECTENFAQTCRVQPDTGGETLQARLAPYDQIRQRHCRDALDACLQGVEIDPLQGCRPATVADFSGTCSAAIAARCGECLGGDIAPGGAPSDCDPFFLGSTIAQDCLNFGYPDFELVGLTTAYCAWQNQLRPSCLNGGATCAHADVEARSFDTFALRYAPFIDAATSAQCVSQADACWNGQPIATVSLEAAPPWREPETGASDDGESCGE